MRKMDKIICKVIVYGFVFVLFQGLNRNKNKIIKGASEIFGTQ